MQQGLPTPSKEKRAYFAGYTDAEGSINVTAANKHSTWCARVSFGQTRPAVLRELFTAYGGVMREVRAARFHWKPQTHWVLQRSSTVICYLQDVLPYLQEKRAQAELVIKHFASRMSEAQATELRRALHNEKQIEIDHGGGRPATAKVCRSNGCTRRSRARGMCTKHYQASRKLNFTPVPAKPFVYGHTPSPTDAAYVAGYFDGDGSYDFRKVNGSWYVTVIFNQTRLEGVRFAQQIYGGPMRTFVPAAPRRTQVTYRIASRAAVMQFLRDIQPYSIERKAEIDLLVAHFKSGMSDEEGQQLKDALATVKATS